VLHLSARLFNPVPKTKSRIYEQHECWVPTATSDVPQIVNAGKDCRSNTSPLLSELAGAGPKTKR
jgi:hypothetical protein